MAIRDLLLLMIIGGLIPVIFYRPWIGVLSWFWIGLMNPHRLTWGFMFSAPVAMWIGLVTLLALLFTKDRRSLPITREVALLILFAMYITMTTYFAWVPSLAWGRWDTVMKIILMTLVTPLLIYGDRRIVLLILVATFSIAFYGFKGGIWALTSGGENMVLGPKKSFISGNTNVGLALVMVIPLILVSARMMTQRWIDFGWRWLDPYYKPIGLMMYATMWLSGIAALFTYSRGALLGVLAIAPFMFLKMRRKLLLVLLLIGTVTVVGFSFPDQLVNRWQTIQTYEEDGSAMTRIQAWGVNWNIAMENPIRGAGFDMAAMDNELWLSYANWVTPRANTARSAHSIYFQLLGHHGFGGAAIWLALVGFTFLTLNRIRRRAREETGQIWMAEYAWAMQVSLIGFLVAGAFLDMAYFNLLFVLIALAVIMRRELEEAPRVEVTVNPEPFAVPPDTTTNGPRFPGFVASSAMLDATVEGGTGKSAR